MAMLGGGALRPRPASPETSNPATTIATRKSAASYYGDAFGDAVVERT
jgi:hypothetical protein